MPKPQILVQSWQKCWSVRPKWTTKHTADQCTYVVKGTWMLKYVMTRNVSEHALLHDIKLCSIIAIAPTICVAVGTAVIPIQNNTREACVRTGWINFVVFSNERHSFCENCAFCWLEQSMQSLLSSWDCQTLEERQCLIHMKHILQRFPRMENALWPGGPGPGPWPLGPRAPARQHDAEMLAGCRETAMRKPVKKQIWTSRSTCKKGRENLRENHFEKTHLCPWKPPWKLREKTHLCPWKPPWKPREKMLKHPSGWNMFFPQGSKSPVKSPWKNLSLVKRDQKLTPNIFQRFFK